MIEIMHMQIDILIGTIDKYNYCLSLGDNTSEIEWLCLTRFSSDDNETHEEASNKIGHLHIDKEVCLCRQHFKGRFN